MFAMSETRAAVALKPEHNGLQSRRWMENSGGINLQNPIILCYYCFAQHYIPAAHACNDVSCSCCVVGVYHRFPSMLSMTTSRAASIVLAML